MCEYSWWYLYIQILNDDVTRRNELYKLVESLLPWINPELWSEYQKQKDKGQENIAYEAQVRAMLQGTFNTDPNAPPINLDEFDVSDAAKQRSTDPQQQGPQPGGIAKQLFDQHKGSIRDLFPGQDPTFRGGLEDLPPEYRDFYNNIPGLENFPPEEPPEDES